jgi:hypothetical protein
VVGRDESGGSVGGGLRRVFGDDGTMDR